MTSEMKQLPANREVLTHLEATFFYQNRGVLKLFLMLGTIPHTIWVSHECSQCVSNHGLWVHCTGNPTNTKWVRVKVMVHWFLTDITQQSSLGKTT